MSQVGLAWRCALVLMFAVVLGGCLPPGEGQLDEEKEPHFLTGRNRAKAFDNPGAIEAFEQALEVNPHSAAAHFELGFLYEKEGDDAAAVFHYERYLKYRPNSDKADLVKAHITYCKTELAKSMSALAPTPQVAHDYEKLLLENRDLKTQLAQWQAYFNANHGQAPASQTSAIPPPAAAHDPPPPAPHADAPRLTQGTSASNANVATSTATNRVSAPGARSYTVKSGDTPSSIARRYGVSVSALLSANPQVRPTRMQPGQTLNIPPP